MAGFCRDDVNFDTEFSELISTLAERRKFHLHWKWLHDQLFFWQKEIGDSALFEHEEMTNLVPFLVPYLQQIFRAWDADDRGTFLKCVGNETTWRYELYQHKGWHCLLTKHDDDPESEELKANDSKIEVCTKVTNLSLEKSNSHEYQDFFIKLDYILNLLIPNNFQYCLYKTAFGRGSDFLNYELRFPYPLTLPKKYFHIQSELQPLALNDGKEVNKKKKWGKKIKNLNNSAPVIVEVPEVEAADISEENKILPLKMALEITDEFWQTFQDETEITKTEEEASMTKSTEEQKKESSKDLSEEPTGPRENAETKSKKKNKKKGKSK